MPTPTRLTPEQRRILILQGTVRLSNKSGLFMWTRKDAAKACSVPTSEETVKAYFGRMENLRRVTAEHSEASAGVKRQARDVGLIN